MVEESDPLPSLLPPEGVVAARLREVVVRSDAAKRVDVAGVRGSADAALIAALVEAEGAPPVVALTEDLEAARRLANDVQFLLGPEDGGRADVLVLGAPETSPFAEVTPDRRAAMTRMAALAHLAADRPLRVLVVPAAALFRKVPPRAVVRAWTRSVRVDEDLDRDGLARDLDASGWLRVPVVEDPGTFAVRGALLDVWAPGDAGPFRIELFGDAVLSIKSFDPMTQTTSRGPAPREIWLPPAREAIASPEAVARAREVVSGLADAIDWPTMKTRVLVEDVTSGRAFFGADAFLPAFYDALEPLRASLPKNARIVVASPARSTEAVREARTKAEEDWAAKAGSPRLPLEAFLDDEASVVADLLARRVIVLHGAAVVGGGDEADFTVFETVRGEPLHLGARDHEDLTRAVKAARASRGRASALAPVARRIRHFAEHGLRVVLTARAETQGERLAQLLSHLGVRTKVHPRPVLAEGAFWKTQERPGDDVLAEIVIGPLTRGLVLPADGLAIVTEEEIFGGRTHRVRERKTKDAARPFLEDLRELKVGDYVVHVEHGLGRYAGLVHREVGGLTVDLLVVEYAASDKLYLPAYRLNQIQKYAGGESDRDVKMDRLGGVTFAKTKARVRKEVRQMADELLRLYAERQAQVGFSIPHVDDEYRAFEATFPFDETDDQARAIEEVNKDLETPRPMDRLVCGDVGFGKTEVAIRAAFRVAMAGKQVAVLCPTTVLAQQHLRTFEARLGDYPVTLKALSRFTSKKESDETLMAIKDGKADIVIGTHRLLSKDIRFKDLGLLVVDEEQRFGVTHKERIKQLRTNVDVLTLSATPIPRTLQMAVSGIRDLSLITTPPMDRRAVRTTVTRNDDQVLREAIGRELGRGGQVFYVYNRIEGLYERAERVQRLFPEARIAVAHGQMAVKSRKRASATADDGDGATAPETALEKTMLDFVEGRYDILVATAIVESGLDIPRANTIIIDSADRFGLAQLYQLRGRVGRSRERAYCYLIVPPPNEMSDESRARIEALERHTELGSGFKIASLDLELRGAGDILGAEQSGNVASVGLDLFCQMLDEAVHELRGETVVHDVDPELSFDVSALLPDDYVSDVGVRLSLYKRLASAENESVVADLGVEMEDRFGPPPPEARCLIRLMTLKCELRRLCVLACEANARSVTLHLRDDTPLDPKKILDLVKLPKSPYKLTPDMRLSRRFDQKGPTADGLANAETLLADLSRALKD